MDHNRVNIRTSGISCGVMELSGITDPEGALYQIAGRLYHPSRGDPVAFLIGSDINSPKTDDDKFTTTNSHKLCMLFLENNVGDVEYTKSAENPKTGNEIIIYTIRINHEAFKKWYSNARIEKLKKVGT